MDALAATAVRAVIARQTDSSSSDSGSKGDKFLKTLSQPFQTELASDTIVSALVISFPVTALIALGFCFLRPYNSVVYAPRAKHADSKHAPPVVSKGLFDWIPAIQKTKEKDLIEKVGLDAAIFMRFCRMLRNLFLVLTVIGCAIVIPINVKNSSPSGFFVRFTPLQTAGPDCWAFVVVTYLFTGVIFFFLWWNYGAVLRLRREYFDSKEYQRSLHARTLLITDIPTELRSDEGVIKITEDVKATRDMPRAAVARNVKDLPDLVEEHDETVRKLEKVLAKYLRNPERLPAQRPTCAPSRHDRGYTGGQVDAIEYLTARIRELELQIKEVRESVDKRNALGYGFASYESIPEAHGVAYNARKTAPHKTIIRLAPRPNDLVWKNLGMQKTERHNKNRMNNIWVGVLTVLWVVPNILMAAFLSNLSHIGNLSPPFNKSLAAHPKAWAVVQAIVPPAISSLFYYYLPAVFRRMCINAGDTTKTSRERHVMHKLYSFFVFNNLIVFCLFSTAFGFVTTVVSKSSEENGWKAVRDAHIFKSLVETLCTLSTYWVTWLLQRNLGAALDLGQVVRLVWGPIMRKFGSPTPRENIELTAPKAFDYAGYYNYFLFYATVAVAFAVLQPLVLPIVAFYFCMDTYMKKYLLMYIFITKYESGGMFWRSLFNRMLVCVLIGNAVVALLVTAKGTGSTEDAKVNWVMLASLAPLPFLVFGFKWFCSKTFDDKMHFYQTGTSLRDAENVQGVEPKGRRGDRVGVRFGNPVLFKPLITPMVSAKSQHLLKSIYSGRTSVDEMDGHYDRAGGYGDVYMDSMDARKTGKPSGAPAPFEFVGENEMDFDHYKNRPEFRDEAGGDGQLFGRDHDHTRSMSPHSMLTLDRAGTSDSFSTMGKGHEHNRSISDPNSDPYAYHSRNISNLSGPSNSASRNASMDLGAAGPGGMEYPRGYHQAGSVLRDHSPAGSDVSASGGRPISYADPAMASRDDLVGHAAGMGRSTPPVLPNISRKPLGLGSLNQFGPGPQGYGPIGGTPGGTPEDEGSYEYFRRGRGL